MPIPSISEVMEAYAKDAVTHACNRGVTLDYSEASLESVDRILEMLTSGGVISPSSPAEENQLWVLSKMYGGYTGEVVIKQMGGQWELHNLANGGARVVLHSGGIQAFPPEKIYKRLTEDRFSGVGGYCRALRAIIEHAGKKG